MSKTIEKVKERFYWTGYEDDIRSWVRDYRKCQPTCATPTSYPGTNPFEKITLEITHPLPVTNNGNKYILVIITDLLTK